MQHACLGRLKGLVLASHISGRWLIWEVHMSHSLVSFARCKTKSKTW